MTRNGVVTRLLDRGMAEVAVERGTACGGSCGGCETCVYASRITISAENAIYARPGDRVILESGSGGVLGAALLVYMLPVAAFFAGYAVGAALALSQGLCVLTSLAGLAAGVALTVVIGRRKRELRFRITGFQR